MIFDHINRNPGFTSLTLVDVINTKRLGYLCESEIEALLIEEDQKLIINLDLTKKPFLPPSLPLEKELDKCNE